MPRQEKICRVCGKNYEACRTQGVKGVFRWQDVSCSPECGAEYLRRVQVARGLISEPVAQQSDLADKSDVSYNEDDSGFDIEPEEEYLHGFGDDAAE